MALHSILYVCLFTVTVRLAGINDTNVNYTGRVEVLYKGKWGRICRDGWDINDVKVVCRQLGFRSALAEFIGLDIKDENVSIVMSNLACKGDELALDSCEPSDGDDNCVDDTGAQAMCEPSKLTFELCHTPVGWYIIFLCLLKFQGHEQ